MTGTLTIVGTGPGDAALLTLAAVAALEASDVVAYPVTTRGSFAARTAEAHTAAARHLPFTVPMTGDGAADAAYDAAAQAIAAELCAGHSVALLCEGDPMLYGSAASLMARLEAFAPTVVPGVTAASACAAAARVSLARGEDALTVLPATAPQERIVRALRQPGALVLYKVGRHFDSVAALVRAAQRPATLVSRGTLADETVVDLAAAPPGPKPYFSTIILPAVAPRETPATERVAIVVLAPSGLATARAARAALGGCAEIHGLAARLDPGEVDVVFADVLHHVGALFCSGVAVVGVCAAGILIRAAAPYCAEKASEPPVIALSQDRGQVVPLLGAHNGGAALALAIGEAFGVAPAFTTRSDALLGVALDDPPAGWSIADAAPFKAIAAALPAEGDGRADPSLTFLPARMGWPADIKATIGAPEPGVATYIARRVALGMGAERGVPADEAIALAHDVLAQAGVDPRAVALVASLDKKADEAALDAVAQALGVPFRVFDQAALAREEHRLATPSQVVRDAVGVSGVAEAAALAAAGQAGELLLPKRVAGRLTAALAVSPVPIAPQSVGRARGHLFVVGIGPGTRDWRTAEASALLAKADAFVGYGLYLDLVEDLRAGRPRHDFPLGKETERTLFALELAGAGQTVALISSGDAGIYAMASLAAEFLEKGDLPDAAQRVALTVAPGISAAQALAARVGAPLGHDFALISLSDLLTPWSVIERRLEAAAHGDFTVALYNPRSQRRTQQLVRAREILLEARSPQTPVVIASSLGRPAEAVHHTTLGSLAAERVDMLATVLVGSSTTRRFVRGDGRTIVYTPRGYQVTQQEEVPA